MKNYGWVAIPTTEYTSEQILEELEGVFTPSNKSFSVGGVHYIYGCSDWFDKCTVHEEVPTYDVNLIEHPDGDIEFHGFTIS